MERTLLKNALAVSDGQRFETDILIEGDLIARMDRDITPTSGNTQVIDLKGSLTLPGVIDDQVHFRDPGLTCKGDIHSESRAAAAGGVTSFIDMPNTNPQTTTNVLMEEKIAMASQKAMVNYGFMLGATNDNLEQIKRIDPMRTAGVKVFMGSSTGNMLVDSETALESIFSNSPIVVVTHCEDEATIRTNLEHYKSIYGDNVPIECHPLIRSAEACMLCSEKAVRLAEKTGARLHLFHLSTRIETSLLRNDIPLKDKKITGEVCVHHLTFDDSMYPTKGNLIKWNPAIKSSEDQKGLWEALLDGRIDVIATDHAPHTFEEKSRPYLQAPSGGPFVQHSLPVMLDWVGKGKLSLETMVQKMSHNPAILYGIKGRGFLREGYKADIAVIGQDTPWTVSKENILYKCGWSPIEGMMLDSKITHTFVNGTLVFHNGNFTGKLNSEALSFNHR